MTSEAEVGEQDAEVSLATESSSLEAAAENRKRRLLEMRSRVQEPEKKRKEGETSVAGANQIFSFRSYEPISDQIGSKQDAKDLFVVEKAIESQLEDTDDVSMVEQVDVGSLAPRKVDWDLKRDVAERMQKLERRTQRAIAALIKERLAKTELATAVNSGAYSELQFDD